MFPPPKERTREQIAVSNEVLVLYGGALDNFFDRLHQEAQRRGWDTQTVREAIEHHCGDEVLDQHEAWEQT